MKLVWIAKLAIDAFLLWFVGTDTGVIFWHRQWGVGYDNTTIIRHKTQLYIYIFYKYMFILVKHTYVLGYYLHMKGARIVKWILEFLVLTRSLA